MSRSESAQTATSADVDAPDQERHPSRDCECPACGGNNGGLRFCAKCRYNGCTAGKALCEVSDDE